MDILSILRWRYATKQYDAAKKIPAEQFEQLLDAAVLSPSSFGLQPWKFLVVENPELRAQLREVSWGQAQVTDASHLIVFLAKQTFTETDIQHFIDRTAAVQGVPAEKLDGYKQMMTGAVVRGKPGIEAENWAKRQVYIALGQTMVAAAAMGIDSTPMEGFDAAKYNEILGLNGTGYTAAVVLPVGYRSPEDKYATAPKVRFEKSELVERR